MRAATSGGKWRYRRLTAGATLAVATTALTGCGSAVVNLIPGRDCVMQANHFHNSKGTPSDMGAKATVVCDTFVTKITIWVDLQKLSGGSWTTVKEDSSPAIYHDVRGSKRVVGSTFMGCKNGTYRARARANVLYRGNTISIPAVFSDDATNPCG